MSSTVPSTSSSNFQLIVKALSDYAEQTGIDLTQNPFAEKLQNCDSADAIFQLLQDRANKFNTYREAHRKLINCLSPVVQVLHALSGTLGEALVLIPFPPAKAIFVGVDILLAAASGVTMSYDALVELFECVANFLKRLHIYTEIPFSPTMTDIIVKILIQVLSVLALATKQIKQGRLKKFAKKLLGETEVEAVLRRLDRLTQDEARMTGAQTLEIVHGLVNNMKVVMNDGRASINDIRQALVAMQEATNEINKMKREQLQKNVRSWLSPPDPSKNHNIAQTGHRDGTAVWFTQGQIFEEWKATGSLLWIRGKPGSGKSILCSSIIEEAKVNSGAGLALMSYYYFDFRDSTKQDIRGLLTSILGQLSAKSDRCCDILSELYSKHDAGSQQPGVRALKQCLINMLGLPEAPMTYIIVDALDECPDTSESGAGVVFLREQILEVVEDLVDLHLPNLRLCFTSRPEADIIDALEPLASHIVSLHDERGQKEDIRDYVKSVVYSDRKMRRWRVEDKELVIDMLVRKADGMFRWVACQLEMLRECFPASLRDALRELPETLDTTYERILLEIKPRNREYTHRLLQCLTVAVRPLRADELAEVLAIRFEAGMVTEYNSGWCLEDAQDAVLSACSSLISIVNVDGSPVVQFSHFSVKEFLTSDRLANVGEQLSRYHILPQPAHTILAQACLSALLRLDDHIDKNGMNKFPLSIYAAQHWVDHGRFEDVSSSIQELMERLFDPDKPHFATWVWIYNIDRPWDWVEQMSSERPTQPEAAALYYAVICGFRRLVDHLVVSCPQEINAEGGTHATPLHAALAKGHFDIALLLLERGADVNALDYRTMSPLHGASESGRRDIVEFLLGPHPDARIQNGNDEMPMDVAPRNGELEGAQVSRRYGVAVDSCDSRGWMPLKSASRSGHLDIMRLLLQNGAAVDSRDNEGWTPLQSASRYGHLDIVRLLLQNGAAVDSRGEDGWTSLKSASRYGHLDIVRLLLQNGAAVDSRGNDGWTSLKSASRYGHLDIVRLLLQNGAAVDSRDNEGWTPLEIASACGHLDIVWLLLQNGAAVDHRDNIGLAPLHSASQNGHLDTVRELLDHGAAVDLNTPDRETALHLASAAGRLNIACLLVERGADPNSRNNDGSTPCHTASSKGHLDVVRLLLEHGTDVDMRNGKHRTPLAVASANGILDVSYFLIERGADVSSADDEGRTSLHFASESGHLNIVRLLLDHGANVNVQCANMCTPLHLVSANGHSKVAELLVERGADVDKRNKSQETPLSEASSNGQLEITRLLLKRGSNSDSKDSKGCTPLHVTAQNGHLDIVKLLVDSSADVNTQNGSEETPLDLAYRNGKRDVVIFLAEVMGVGVDYWVDMGGTMLDVAPQDTDSDVVESSPNHGDSANFLDYETGSLDTASRQGNVRTVRSLLARGADVNERDAFNQTPLGWASREGRLEVAELLIEHGADLNSRDKAGWTPLHSASRDEHLDVARLLLDQGADVDAQNRDLWTPLHLASANCYLEVVMLLLERGANVHVRNNEGLTASQLASRIGEREIVRLLSEY